MPKLVLALGGNSLIRKGEKENYETQMENLRKTFYPLKELIEKNKIAITHGNGPQVGNLLLMEKKFSLNYPLHMLVAMTQAEIGSMVQEIFQLYMKKWNLKKEVNTVLTRVVVDKKDKGFKNPSKPIGPFHEKNNKEETLKKVSGGYRIIVPSPKPEEIVEIELVKKLMKKNIVVCCGGGGIPVVKERNGYKRVEAVIDKDLSSSLLAREIKAKELIILTNVPFVYLNFGKKSQEKIGKVSFEEIEELWKKDEFEEGSMKPKIESSIEFLKNTGKKAIICSSENVGKALKGKSGTIIRK